MDARSLGKRGCVEAERRDGARSKTDPKTSTVDTSPCDGHRRIAMVPTARRRQMSQASRQPTPSPVSDRKTEDAHRTVARAPLHCGCGEKSQRWRTPRSPSIRFAYDKQTRSACMAMLHAVRHAPAEHAKEGTKDERPKTCSGPRRLRSCGLHLMQTYCINALHSARARRRGAARRSQTSSRCR